MDKEIIDLAKNVAKYHLRRMASSVDFDDLFQEASIAGWLHSKDELEPGTNRQGYLRNYMNNAIWDWFRSTGRLSRLHFNQVRSIESSRDRLQNELGRAPTAGEIAAASDMDIDYMHSVQLAFELENVVDLMPEPERSPEQVLAARRAVDAVAAVYDQLSEREQLVLDHYFNNQGRAAADKLGLTESRVSQIAKGAMMRVVAAAEACSC